MEEQLRKEVEIWLAKILEKVKDTCKSEIKGIWDMRKL